MRVLTEASGSLVSSGLIKSLQSAGQYVVATDITPFNAGGALANEYVQIAPISDANLWTSIIDVLENRKIDWVVPTFDEMLLGWSSRQVELKQIGVNLLLSPFETIKIFSDKWSTYKAFTKVSLPTPRTSLDQEYPLVKPRIGRGSRGVKVTNEKIEMEGMISQEIAEGVELTVDCFFGIDGKPIYIVPRIRKQVINGKSVSAETVESELISSYIIALASAYHFIGPINVQCFLSDGAVTFIEVNPRMGGGSILGFAATQNWFDLWFNFILQGKTFLPKQIEYGMRMDRYYSEVFTPKK